MKPRILIVPAQQGNHRQNLTQGFMGVPMLAYPLDPPYDQNGNALKIEYHGLGLRGVFAHERPNDLKNKLLRLLAEPIFKVKVAEMSTTILGKYTAQYVDAQLDECLSRKLSLTMDLRESKINIF